MQLTGDDSQLAERRVGEVLREKYQLEALIGMGGVAAVYRAVHRNGYRVAVKVLRPELTSNRELVARFLKESYIANAVDHRSTVRVLDDDVAADGSVFLVMDLLQGQTLSDRRESNGGRLSAREVILYAYVVADVLASAHAAGIVHRDIKPANVFLTREGVIKVLDFGIARMREVPNATETRAGTMMGTPAFMPPEQALGRVNEIDGRTDLWALGATMFTLLSGVWVHDADTPEAMMIHSATQPARSLRAVAPHVPEALAAIVDRALKFDRNDRFPDARAMQRALTEAYTATFGAGLPRESGSSSWNAPELDGVPSVAKPGPLLSTTSGIATGRPSRPSQGDLSAREPTLLPARSQRGAWIAVAVASAFTVFGLGAAVAVRPAPTVVPQMLETRASELPPTTVVAPTTPAAAEPVASEAGVFEAAPIPVEPPTPPTPTAPPAARLPSPPSLTSPAASPATSPRATRPKSVVPAAACDPPYVIDPITHGRKVKPGC